MSRRPAQLVLTAFMALALGACGQQSPYGVDAYGNPIDPYASTGYDTGSYGSGYDTGYSSGSYGTGYDTGYSSGSYGTGYGTDTTTGTTSGSYGDYGTSYGDDAIAANPNALASPGATPTPSARPVSLPPVLSAWVTEVKEPGFLSRLTGGKITCKVEIENPTDRTLSGKLRVRFLDNGNPTGVIQTKRVTLQPKEKQVLTFSAEALRLDDAEATIETEAPTTSGGAVVDRVTDRTPSPSPSAM